MDYSRGIPLLKSTSKWTIILLALFLLTACKVEIKSDYNSFQNANPSRVLYILNGSGETLSALDCESDVIYNNLQTLGHDQWSRGIPNDILVQDGYIYVLLSGQNSVECYDALSLDYLNRCYLKNGFNPLNFIPVGETGYAFITGYLSDEIVLINLKTMQLSSSFASVYEAVTLPSGSHEESTVPLTIKNSVGENKHRGVTGGAVALNGTNSRLYLSNVRYDPKILLTDGSGQLVQYNGSNVRANGYFRQGTLSIFSFNADALGGGGSGDPNLILMKEINLDALYRAATGEPEYYPGDGLNVQSLTILDGRLHVVCTGTNGGVTRQFSSGEYIPVGYSAGDNVPGTNPDDGVILILDISDGDNPVYFYHLTIGGSPSLFRQSMDEVNKNVYLSGVGGIHAYSYGSMAVDFNILRGRANPVVQAENPSVDYYSHLLYDSKGRNLYASFFSESRLLSIAVSGTAGNPIYGTPVLRRTGDGPGALALWER